MEISPVSFDEFYQTLSGQLHDDLDNPTESKFCPFLRLLREIPSYQARVARMRMLQILAETANLPEKEKRPEDFHIVLQHIISHIRATAIFLYIQGKNNGGFTLIHGEEIGWERGKKHMEQLLEQHQLLP